jgi:ribonuclease R
MKRAFYSDEDLGHFALGLEHYCHFTSPIRRYPDLIVHRRLAELIASGPLHGEKLDRRARASGLRHAVERTRAAPRRPSARCWSGRRSSSCATRSRRSSRHRHRVMPFGLFVELTTSCRMVPIATVGGDTGSTARRSIASAGESTNRELRLGDHVVVEVKSNEDRHQIEFPSARARWRACFRAPAALNNIDEEIPR